MIEKGTIIKNKKDIVVLEVKPDWNGTGQIVLAFIPYKKEYVTWWYSPDSLFVQGHYTTRIDFALEDFKKRS